MPAMILITCPHCKKQLKGPADLQGKRIRCKACEKVFAVPGGATAAPAAKGKPQAPAKPAAKPPEAGKAAAKAPEAGKAAGKPAVKAERPEDSTERSSNPYQLSDAHELTYRCPQCAFEMGSEDAIICLNCGYNTQTRLRIQTVRTYETTSMDVMMWLAPGIICAVVVLLMIGAICWLWIALRNSEGWWVFPSQIWGSVFAAGIGWFCGKFAFKRLILHPRPPEIIRK